MTTPNMGLDLPTPGVTAGSLWAAMLIAALLLIDEHDHSTGNGSSIPSSAIVWPDNTDLQTIGLFNANFYGFQAVGSPPDAETMLYVDGDGELHYHDQSGHDLKLTLAGALNLTSTRGINGDYATDPANPSLYFDTSGKFYYFAWDDTDHLATIKTGGLCVGLLPTAINYNVLDDDGVHTIAVDTSAAVTIHLPSVTQNHGRQLTIKDATGGAASHNITITRTSPDTIDGATSKTINIARGVLRLICDGNSQWLVV